MIVDKYNGLVDDLFVNDSVHIIKDFSRSNLKNPSSAGIEQDIKDIREFAGIEMSETNAKFFRLSGVSVCWNSNLPEGGRILSGGFRINGIADALCFNDDFWRGAIPLAPGQEVPEELKHYEKLNWFQKSADGTTQPYGCFIRQPGPFPPPIAIYYRGWYTGTAFDFEEYLARMFECFAFVGWQFFYVDFPGDIKDLEEILDNMKFATEILPKVFPGKDWSYFTARYEQTLKRLGR